MFQKFSGFTLVELLIVIAVIGILAMIVLLGLRGGTQLAKARDARRKGDMAKIQRCLEEYNNDHGYYLPVSSYSCGGTVLAPCMATISCDPFKHIPYQYETDGTATPRWYRLYAKIDYTSDPLYCSVCGVYGNYYVASPNAPVIATPTPTAGPTPPPGATSTLTPSPTPACQNPTAAICGQPQNYVGICGSCCAGVSRMQYIDGVYTCCADASCQ